MAFEGVDSGMFADALDILGFDGAMIGLRPAWTGQRFWGRAVTVRMLVGTPGTFQANEIALGRIMGAAGNGDVVVIDIGGEPITAWGELTTLAAKSQGVAGAVIDGAARDIDILRAQQFPVLLRHATPKAGKTRLRLGSVNEEPVTCGGVTVHPGDFIFADDSGAVVVPQRLYDQALDEMKKVKAMEDAFKAGLAKGLPYAEASKQAQLNEI